MKHSLRLAVLLLGSTFCLLSWGTEVPDHEVPGHLESEAIAPAATLSEARSRARLLHEMIHGSLQVVHRDFFDDDNPSSIPSASFEDVFAAMEESYQVKLKWLIVETDMLNVDHQPVDDFEHAAVKALRAGEPRYEEVQQDRYRFAGPIRLASQCLKCHVKNRTTTEDRTAGILISMPLKVSR